MNEPLYTTSSPTAAEFRTEGQSSSLKTTGSQVVHFTLGTARYMISPHAERGQAVKVTMQGPTVAVVSRLLSSKRPTLSRRSSGRPRSVLTRPHGRRSYYNRSSTMPTPR